MNPIATRSATTRTSGVLPPALHGIPTTGPGRVSLVGAGPGDPELITVRGLRRLREADAVLYDRLAPVELLDEAPDDAERIYCGKAPGAVAMSQEQIQRLMIELAQAGQRVVRLKGGDPYVLGRGGEEGLALSAADIDWEVVPGVTSAVAVPAMAGIPMTHRGIASSFAVVTGHCCQRAAGRLGLPAADTLVVLMGVSNLGRIRCDALAQGRPADTPVAIVECGTLPSERTTVATLAELEQVAAQARARPPAVVVVGEVVRLRNDLRAGAGSLQVATGAGRKLKEVSR